MEELKVMREKAFAELQDGIENLKDCNRRDLHGILSMEKAYMIMQIKMLLRIGLIDVIEWKELNEAIENACVKKEGNQIHDKENY